MAKTTTQFVCESCGATFSKWSGKCLSCGAWDSLVESVTASKMTGNKITSLPSVEPAQALSKIKSNQTPRMSCGNDEVDTVA